MLYEVIMEVRGGTFSPDDGSISPLLAVNAFYRRARQLGAEFHFKEKITGQRIIQTLPINDTTLNHSNSDSYPYNAVSVYALHPIYLNLDSIGKLKTKKKIEILETKKQELNAKYFLDYQSVMSAKWEFFREIYPVESDSVFASDEYKTFFSANNVITSYSIHYTKLYEQVLCPSPFDVSKLTIR